MNGQPVWILELFIRGWRAWMLGYVCYARLLHYICSTLLKCRHVDLALPSMLQTVFMKMGNYHPFPFHPCPLRIRGHTPHAATRVVLSPTPRSIPRSNINNGKQLLPIQSRFQCKRSSGSGKISPFTFLEI